MPRLSDTIAHLAQLRTAFGTPSDSFGSDKLVALEAFGSNPGALSAKTYFPDPLPGSPALVVVLHGCTQTAAGYDVGAGWSELADRYGFALLFPEQQRQNNGNLCFNWFSPEDTQRGQGEAFSIRQMIATVVDAHGIDPNRIYVTGLSAGGAMASAMLATYPEIFAGGAIIAGLPYGCASSIPQAFERMRGHGLPGERDLAAAVRNASHQASRWPTISVWQGSADTVVNPANAAAIIDQWRALHGAATTPSRTEIVDGYSRRVWRDDRGGDAIEEYAITGMGHGVPLNTSGENSCGRSGAYMLEAKISSTYHICRFWGLAIDCREAPNVRGEVETSQQERVAGHALVTAEAPPRRTQRILPAPEVRESASGVGKIIEDALRAAGLMR